MHFAFGGKVRTWRFNACRSRDDHLQHLAAAEVATAAGDADFDLFRGDGAGDKAYHPVGQTGNAVTAVAENGNGTVCAYAYAVKAFGRNCLNFKVHPDNTGETKELLEFTASEFRKLFPGEPILIYLGSNCQLQLEALEKAHFSPIAKVPGSAPGADLLIFEI